MSFQPNFPPSKLSRIAKIELENGAEQEKKISREEYKKLKELEEARKAGTAPAMQDEEGKDINPHIPQYIMQAPWYFGSDTPTLKHQRVPEPLLKKYQATPIQQWYKKGVKSGSMSTKFRKGACENCGALTHTKKDCLERPRRVGAKYTGEKIAPDEYSQPDFSMDYDGKRDRWNGYDPTMHKKVIEDFAFLEEAKKQLKSQTFDNEAEKDKEDTDEVDEDKYADDMDMPGQKFETKQRITVRNLRIREDTAKYLFNLDVNSAFYDPKTRAMRGNPFQDKGKKELETPFAGDNFIRWSGDAHKMAERQMFAWEAYEKGTDVNLQADPTKLELLNKEYKRKTEEFKVDKQKSILEKYGGKEHLDVPSKELLLSQSENYVEYSRSGNVIKGEERAKIKSRYAEDVYENNHTSVWGSYWKNGKWGYACCQSIFRQGYCTGKAGIEANNDAIKHLELMERQQEENEKNQKDEITEISKNKEKNRKKKEKKKIANQRKRRKSSSSSLSSNSNDNSNADDEEEDVKREKRIKMLMDKEDKRQKDVSKFMKLDERKRPYNSMYEDKPPTEEELEAYRRKQHRKDDPMANFLNK